MDDVIVVRHALPARDVSGFVHEIGRREMSSGGAEINEVSALPEKRMKDLISGEK